MQIKIEEHASYKEKVPYTAIHGKFPYKLYLEVKGNCKYGRYIVVVSDTELKDVESIQIKVNSKQSMDNLQQVNVVKQKDFIIFNAKQVPVFDVVNIPLYVFKPLDERKKIM